LVAKRFAEPSCSTVCDYTSKWITARADGSESLPSTVDRA
jgi:hypothetical protein